MMAKTLKCGVWAVTVWLFLSTVEAPMADHSPVSSSRDWIWKFVGSPAVSG